MERAKTQRVAGVIPARYASTRFPGKPLALIGGRPMIQMVYEKASQVISDVFVATDDERIAKAVDSFGGKFIMTSSDHLSGTDRCAEAATAIEQTVGHPFDIIINIQGDEPFVKSSQIASLINCFSDRDVEIATLIRKVREDEVLDNPNQPKVVIDRSLNALYFSRSVIPFIRDSTQLSWHETHSFYKHIGVYAYRYECLKKLSLLMPTPLEKAESLEQIRWLENGFRIRTVITDWESIGIDTPEDLIRAEEFLRNMEQQA